jgi:hypothetical protein
VTRRSRLGVIVGAFFCIAAHAVSAQVVVPPASEVPIPPKPQTDSTGAKTDSAKAKADTIQAAFNSFPLPGTSDIGPQYQWNREQMYASGAYTLADLLERIPGTTSLRTGWLASPKFVAVNGDLSRVRVYYDGLEIDNLDPRTGGLLDLTTIDLWTLDGVSVERFGGELRVHVRSWRVERTDPYTRVDVYTGDEDTNIYRGFYGKRWGSGFGLQLGGQQWSTRSARFGGGGDALSFMGRVGIARKGWSIDGYATRRNASRVVQPIFADTEGLSLQPFEGTQTIAYLRGTLGNQSGGPWAQILASNMRLGEESSHIDPSVALSSNLLADTTDTTTQRIQYLGAVGITTGAVRASITDRMRAFKGEKYHSPEARVELGGRFGNVDLVGEKDGVRKRKKLDGAFRLTPISFLAIGGGITYDAPSKELSFPTGNVPDVGAVEDSTSAPVEIRQPKSTSTRIEAGVRLWNPWLSVGFLTRDTAVLAPLAVVDTAYHAVAVGKRSGMYASLRGRLYKDLNVDVVGMRWDSAGFYQPRYQSRSELFLDTRWLRRFPSGTFGLKVAAIHDYRGVVRFPTADGFRISTSSSVTSGLLEIRILRGVASYQVRNVFAKNYQIVPGFYMPRSVGIYGLRWEFWN